jgi:hypothetical protein
MLTIGGYSYYRANVVGFGGANDCEISSGVTCPAFDRVRMGSDGRFVTDTWAYYPVQKKWVSLQANENIVFQDGSEDIRSDGAFWSRTAFSPTTTAAQIKNNRRIYSYGTVGYQLGVGSVSLAGKTIVAGVPAAGSFSGNAKNLIFNFEQISGNYYVLKQGGLWTSASSTDDKKAYTKLADLRAAHTNLENSYCLDDALDSDRHVVFNAQQPGASIYTSSGICRVSSPLSGGTVVQEGVATVGGRKLIVLQNLFSGNSKSSSELQYLPIIGLSDAGVGARGRHYFVGYSKAYSGYVNEAAFLEWMKAQYNDAAALSLPR